MIERIPLLPASNFGANEAWSTRRRDRSAGSISLSKRIQREREQQRARLSHSQAIPVFFVCFGPEERPEYIRANPRGLIQRCVSTQPFLSSPPFFVH